MASKKEMKKAVGMVKNPALKEILSRMMNNIKISPPEELKEIKKQVSKSPGKYNQLVFAFLPHEMAKVSIFFPMSDRELKAENRKINTEEYESNWGKVKVEGVKLAIFEEDIFLALMKVGHKKIKASNGEYLLETNIKNIIHLLYGTSRYSTKKSIDLILRSLDNFQLVKFSITLFNKKFKNNKEINEDGLRGSIGNIIQSYYHDPKTQNIKIYFNPHFYMLFMKSMLTHINFTVRRKMNYPAAS